jgi:hypothetical protein
VNTGGWLCVALLVAGLAGADGSAPAGGAPLGRIRTDPARLARLREATMPRITEPVLFGTPDADATCAALEVFPPEVRTILRALQRYGMFVADNGIEWAVSVAPDPRLPSLHAELRRVTGASFEVVVPPQ